MKYSKFVIKQGLFLIVALFFMVPSVLAYLDPGSGAMFLQTLIAGVAVALFSIKIYWHKIKEKLTKTFSTKKEVTEVKRMEKDVVVLGRIENEEISVERGGMESERPK